MSWESPRSVIDTVVLLYFLLVDEVQLLLDIVGRPAAVPRVVFDPDEGEPEETAASEMQRSIRYHERRSRDGALDEDHRSGAAVSVRRLMQAEELYETGELVIADLDSTELELFADLIDAQRCATYDLLAPLGMGEAACLAIAKTRAMTLVTDDNDGLRTYQRLVPGGSYERIRRLLARGAEEGLITRERANEIHQEMRRHGFWDAGRPFED